MMRRALLTVVSLLVLCIVLDVVLRVTHLFNARLSWTEPDRQICWRLSAGREYWYFSENDHPITGRINSMGWRDRERSVAKPAGMRRIAVLGDSFVEGIQVELDSTFVSRAEDAYRNAGSLSDESYEVMSFGRSGMSPVEESIVLDHDVFPCEPDMVLLLFTPHNDISDVNPKTAADTSRPFFSLQDDSLRLDTSFVSRRDFRVREAINPLKLHSALVSLVLERYNYARLRRSVKREAESRASRMSRAQTLCTSHPDSVFLVNYALCKRLIARMAHECAARGIRFELASVPLGYEADNVARLRAEDPSFDPGFFDRDLAVLADSSGFRFLPMTAEFAARSRNGVKLQWQHWNYQGHEAAFDILLNPLPRLSGAATETQDNR